MEGRQAAFTKYEVYIWKKKAEKHYVSHLFAEMTKSIRGEQFVKIMGPTAGTAFSALYKFDVEKK